MANRKKRIVLKTTMLLLLVTGAFFAFRYYQNYNAEIGDQIDELDGVAVYFNKNMGNISGRTLGENGYNIGLKYQCVEFVKRYYYEHYHHEMPNSYGNAIDFFNPKLSDGEFNAERGLLQFTNPSSTHPQKGDLLIYGVTSGNSFGHVSIVASNSSETIEIIQQNAGGIYSTRARYSVSEINGKYSIENDRILGWLRMKQ